MIVSHVTLAQGVVRIVSSMFHVLVCLDLFFHSPLCTLHSLSHLHLPCGSVRGDPLCTSSNEELCTLADNAPLTGYEPNFLNDYHFSETTEIFIQESSSDTRPSNLHDSEISDHTIGRALSSPLFTQERQDPADLRQTYHSHEERLLPTQPFFTRTSTGRPERTKFRFVSKTEIKSRLRKRAKLDSS